MFKICMLALVGIAFATILKGSRQEYAYFLILTLGAYLFMVVLERLSLMMTELVGIQELVGDYAPYLSLLMRITGITYICQFASNLCRDSGYGGIAEQVEMIGKLWIMFMGLPILMNVVRQIENLW